mgnify:CR=1 FL=1
MNYDIRAYETIWVLFQLQSCIARIYRIYPPCIWSSLGHTAYIWISSCTNYNIRLHGTIWVWHQLEHCISHIYMIYPGVWSNLVHKQALPNSAHFAKIENGVHMKLFGDPIACSFSARWCASQYWQHGGSKCCSLYMMKSVCESFWQTCKMRRTHTIQAWSLAKFVQNPPYWSSVQFISGKVGGSSHGFMGGTGSRMASACGGICFYMAKLSLPWHGVVRCVLLPWLTPCKKRTLPNSAR